MKTKLGQELIAGLKEAITRERWLRTGARPDADLIQHVSQYFESAKDALLYDWHEDPAFPVAKTTWAAEDKASAVAWLAQEEADWIADYGEPKMTEEEKFAALSEPIVVIPSGDTGLYDPIDGQHRCAEAIKRGIPTLPAIVGTRRAK